MVQSPPRNPKRKQKSICVDRALSEHGPRGGKRSDLRFSTPTTALSLSLRQLRRYSPRPQRSLWCASTGCLDTDYRLFGQRSAWRFGTASRIRRDSAAMTRMSCSRCKRVAATYVDGSARRLWSMPDVALTRGLGWAGAVAAMNAIIFQALPHSLAACGRWSIHRTALELRPSSYDYALLHEPPPWSTTSCMPPQAFKLQSYLPTVSPLRSFIEQSCGPSGRRPSSC